MSTETARRIPALTGLRFVAALLVFLGHAGNNLRVPDNVLHASWRVPILTHNTTGVGLFFALSGFVIMLSYGEPLRRGAVSARQFLLRRVARLWPAYLVATTLFIPIGIAQHHQAVNLLLTYAGLQSWVPTDGAWQQWNGLEWSVSTEAFFYVLFAVVGGWLARQRGRQLPAVLLWVGAWVVLVAVSLVVHRQLHRWPLDWTTYRFPVVRSLEFVMGAATALVFQARGGRPLPWRTGGLSALTVVALMLTTRGVEFAPLHYPVVFVPLLSITLYWLAASTALPARLLGSEPMQRLGDWSYAFYLLHAMVYIVVGHVLRGTGALTGLPGIGAAVLACFVISTALSAAMHHLVELPAQRALLRRWEPQVRPAAVPAA